VVPFFTGQMAANRIAQLPIDVAHLAPIATLPFHHKDPFDRLLIAQSIVEGVPLLSADTAFDAYAADGLNRIW
jgi:PIN domain nuclease of toxin-antitoxin system